MMARRANKPRRAYGEGSVTQRKSGLWVGRIEAGWDSEGKRRQVTVTSMDHAVMLDKLDKAKAELRIYGYTADPTATLTQWIEKWLTEIATKTVRGKTYAGYASILRKWVEPTIGRRRLSKLGPDDWRAVRDAMIAGGLSTTTARQCYYALRSCIAAAHREGLVTTNFLDRTQAPRAAANQRGAFTPDQARAILRTANTRHIAAMLTGARQSELLGLTWPTVTLDGPTPSLRIEWQLQELRNRHECGARGTDGRYPCGFKQAARCPVRSWQVPEGHEYLIIEGRLALVRPKSRHGDRHIPLVPALVAVLAHHQAHNDPGPYGLVWHDGGHPVRHKDDEAEWKRAVVAAGLPADRTLHWARHSAATLLMDAGVDTKIVGEIVGHGAVAVTRGYQHVSSESAQRGMAKLGELLG